jgi:adenylate kinase
MPGPRPFEVCSVHVILMGAQGSGKGTQAALLGPKLKLTKIATGDLFRKEIAAGSPLGLQLKGILDRGDLVPDDLTNAIVHGWIGQIIEQREAGGDVVGALFDGFPRTSAQAVALDDILAGFGESVTAVVEIDVPRDILIERLAGRRVCTTCGAVFHVEANPPKVDGVCDNCGGTLIQRDDDQPDAIARRLALYDEQTAPLLGYYREQGKLMTVDGDQAIDAVTAAVQAAIESRVAGAGA